MGVLGLLGGLLGGGGKVSKRDSRSNAVVQSQVSKSSADPTAAKAKAAGKLALIKTSAGGVLNDSTSGRKKLLGN